MDQRITCVYSDKPESWEQHFHNTHELVYVQAGGARFTIGGEVYEAGPHTLIFISKSEMHSTAVTLAPYRRWWVRATTEQLAAAADDVRLRAVWERRPAGFCHAFAVAPIAGEVEGYLSAMAAERPEDPFARQRCEALLRLLLIALWRLRPEQFPLPAYGADLTAERIQRYIDSHFSEEIRVGDLARRFGLSGSYLTHSFSRWAGVSPGRYILLCRLSLARELLLTSDLPVAGVAARCGFGDVSNFIRLFRSHTGCTPAAYRKGRGLPQT